MHRKEITEEQFQYAVSNGDFGPEVTESNSAVIVVLTQDWCMQWVFMRMWIDDLLSDESVDIYELVYNRVPYFMEVLAYKEQIWGNFEVPYLRYYRDGHLIGETNFVGKQHMKRLIAGAG